MMEIIKDKIQAVKCDRTKFREAVRIFYGFQGGVKPRKATF